MTEEMLVAELGGPGAILRREFRWAYQHQSAQLLSRLCNRVESRV
jgi:hypothetical protein